MIGIATVSVLVREIERKVDTAIEIKIAIKSERERGREREKEMVVGSLLVNARVIATEIPLMIVILVRVSMHA